MSLLTSWQFWTILYLISAVLYAQTFKKLNRKMEDANSLTILLEATTGFLSLLFIFFFPIKFPMSLSVYLILLIVAVIYAITDRLNIEARYGLEPSTFSMLKQLSTVFIILFGIVLFNEKIIFHKMIGAIIIILANVLLTFKNGKLQLNKYLIMSVCSNILFAIAMLINVNISNSFNIAIYTFITTFFPALIMFIISKSSIKKLKKEISLYDKKKFIFVALMWSIMLIASVKAYEFGNIVIVASFLALTSILNAAIELVIYHDKKQFIKKLLIALMIVGGIILVKM